MTTIERIRETTAQEVAKKNDKAKLNFPTPINTIEMVARSGKYEATFPENQINEYDRKLVIDEGFTVRLIDVKDAMYNNDYKFLPFVGNPNKQWIVRW